MKIWLIASSSKVDFGLDFSHHLMYNTVCSETAGRRKT